MSIDAAGQLSQLLELVGRALDIPDDVFEDATRKYTELGRWLEERDALLARQPPKVYAQGSFALGTVIRPPTDKDEYDVDLVYERDLRKESTTQKDLRDQAGEHLKAYVEHCQNGKNEVPTLASGRRCWRLQYSTRFHMDILPAIPDDEGRGAGALSCETAIRITDRTLREWLYSNPAGYAVWFRERMRVRFEEQRTEMAMEKLAARGVTLIKEAELREAVAQVPEYAVKTPLQRAVQILKRHRCFFFEGDPDNSPASIIISTLAASAYDNEANLLETLLKLVTEMPGFIKYREAAGQRIPWVANPVNGNENFADRWLDAAHPDRERKFRGWLQRVGEDLRSALAGGGLHKVVDLLGRALGEGVARRAAKGLGDQALCERQSGKLAMVTESGLLGSTGGTKVREHSFHGEGSQEGR